MARNDSQLMIPDELIMNKIYLIRRRKVMFDMDLAELYGVETKQLKRAVRRNIERFPEDFMFELSKNELSNWRCQFGTSNREKMGIRIPPFAFTEQGVAMLSGVLNSKLAIKVNIQIIRIFTKMREMLLTNKEIIHKLDKMEKKLTEHDDKIMLIFEYLKQLEQTKQKELKQKSRTIIEGYRKSRIKK